MNNVNLYALLIGIMVMLAIYMALMIGIGKGYGGIQRTLLIFSAMFGLLTTLYLQENPILLDEYSEKIVISGLGILLSLLVFLRLKLK